MTENKTKKEKLIGSYKKEVVKILMKPFFRVSSLNYKKRWLIAIISCAFSLGAHYYFMH
jgi:hypothetical protein